MFRSKNWNFLFLMALTLFVVLVYFDLIFAEKIKSPTKPLCGGCSVLIIDLDILRADAIDCVSARERTPNICRFADDSVSFDNNISQSDLTINSLVSMLTSLYPSSHGIWNESYPTRIDGIDFIQDILSEAGYSTIIAGSVAQNRQIIKNGFGTMIDSNDFQPKKVAEGIADQLSKTRNRYFLLYYIDDLHFPYLLYKKEYKNSEDVPSGVPLSSTDFWNMQTDYVAEHYSNIFTQEALDKNKELFTGNIEKNKNKIYQLFLGYSYQGPKQIYLKNVWAPLRDTYFKNADPKDPSVVNYMKDDYLQTLHIVDNYLGYLFNYVDKYHSRDTIVILNSNHGEEFFEHGSFSHQNDLYQELIHTPLYIKVPGVKPSRVSGLTQDIDIMPTILDLLGFTVPVFAQGKSLTPLLTDKTKTVRDYQIAQKGGEAYVETFRKGNWKIVVKQDTPIKLFDLLQDPEEEKNVIAEKLDLAKKLFTEYKKVIDTLPKYGFSGDPLPTWVDNEKRQRLKDEGYF